MLYQLSMVFYRRSGRLPSLHLDILEYTAQLIPYFLEMNAFVHAVRREPFRRKLDLRNRDDIRPGVTVG